MIILLMVFGIGLCVLGADFLVRGSSGLAAKLRVPPLVVGLTIVAFGTSLPELVVGVSASLKSNSDVILGNVLGSNTFNSLFILGIAALILPLSVEQSTIKREIPFSVLMTGIFFILANDTLFGWGADARLTRLDSAILLILFAIFIFLALQSLKKQEYTVEKAEQRKSWQLIALTILGLGLLILGGELAVRYAIKTAFLLHINESLIAATIIAGGTSLPELVTSAYAAFRKEPDIAVGNVVGSNIFNLLFIPGVSGAIGSINYASKFNFDLGFYLLGTIILLVAMFTGTRRKLDRGEAVILLVLYAGYVFHILHGSNLV